MIKTKGFAILTITIILTVSVVLFTINIAKTQMLDNQIIGHYYRISEARVNSDSGIAYVMNIFKTQEKGLVLLNSLPITYTTDNYEVDISKIGNKIDIKSIGYSNDKNTYLNTSLSIYITQENQIPLSAISSNGKLNIDDSGNINDGCDGLSSEQCRNPNDKANPLIVSNPSISNNVIEGCSSISSKGKNEISESSIYSYDAEIIENGGDWSGEPTEHSVFENIDLEENLVPSSLFESTFGIEYNDDNIAQIKTDSKYIDMTDSDGLNCSEQLDNILDSQKIIYIKGDCDISQYSSSNQNLSENKRFVIGSTENPKIVFIEGGSFITQPNTGAGIVGMLYFLPTKEYALDDDGNTTDEYTLSESVDMGGIRVDGALLSEYECSHDGYDKTNNKNTKQHFSSRYNKNVLLNLYEDLGVNSTEYSYGIEKGSWRDF